jgi:hypothetical protein
MASRTTRSVQRLRRTLDDAKAKFAAAWGAWFKAAGLNEDTPTAQLKDSDSGPG